jgi:hypothetical protein
MSISATLTNSNPAQLSLYPFGEPVESLKLLHPADLKSQPPLSWKVKGLLPDTGTALFYGASGAAKSFLLLDLACAIAEGKPWFGHLTSTSPVIYLCLEGAAGFSNRIQAWEKGSHRSFPESVRFIVAQFSLFDTAHVSALIKIASSLKSELAHLGSPVVIVDTLNRAMPGGDENGSQHIGLILQSCSHIAGVSGGLVILAHHIGKDADRGPRGHSSMIPSVDASIVVKRSKGERTWESQKVKDGQDGRVFQFALDSVVLGIDSDGDPITSCHITPGALKDEGNGTENEPLSDQQLLGLQSLAEVLCAGAPGCHMSGDIEAWRSSFYARTSAKSDSGKRNAFNRARSDLRERGLVREEGQAVFWENAANAFHCPAMTSV